MGLLNVQRQAKLRNSRFELLGHASLNVGSLGATIAILDLDEAVHVDPVRAVVDDTHLHVSIAVDAFLQGRQGRDGKPGAIPSNGFVQR